jgi:thioredoxin-like negative regulator of GroEL
MDIDHMMMYTAAGLGTTWLVYLGYIYVASKAMTGLEVKAISKELPFEPSQTSYFIYCFAPNCGPCKFLSPLVDKLIDEGFEFHKVDIAKHYAFGKDLGIRTSPTIVKVENNTVVDVLVGGQQEHKLRTWIAQ